MCVRSPQFGFNSVRRRRQLDTDLVGVLQYALALKCESQAQVCAARAICVF